MQLLCHVRQGNYLAGFIPPPSPTPSPDGKSKYFQSGNYTAKILVPDHGRPMVPAVAYVVDSFLLPPKFTGV